jgi:hypothetical protein
MPEIAAGVAAFSQFSTGIGGIEKTTGATKPARLSISQ